jgi:ElaB/YqjD/DUF883 family membrane-anchored ribosome-binding protein
MKTETQLKNADQTAEQDKSLYNRALEKTREGAEAADELLHHHAYKLLAMGMLAGLVTGYLVSQRYRCCSR